MTQGRDQTTPTWARAGARASSRARARTADLIGVDPTTWIRQESLVWALLAAGGYGAVRLARLEVGLPLVILVVLTAALLRRLVATFAGRGWPRPGPPGAPRENPNPTSNEMKAVSEWSAALDTAGLTWWENRLTWLDGDARAFDDRIRPRLIGMVDERLRLRHGITRADNPGQAEEILGERLASLVSHPSETAVTPRELEAIVAEIERL